MRQGPQACTVRIPHRGCYGGKTGSGCARRESPEAAAADGFAAVDGADSGNGGRLAAGAGEDGGGRSHQGEGQKKKEGTAERRTAVRATGARQGRGSAGRALAAAIGATRRRECRTRARRFAESTA